jgi:ATP/maltotriose-dependent transcriptional regulator MalT
LVTLVNLARIAVARGAADEAASTLHEALTLAGEPCSEQLVQMVLTVATGLAVQREEWPRAGRYFGAAEAQLAQVGIRREAADEAFVVTLIARASATSVRAAFDAGVAEGRTNGYQAALVHHDEGIADLRLTLGGRRLT